MAYLGSYSSKKTGKVYWRVIFRKRAYDYNREVKKDISRGFTFSTKKEAQEFIEKYDHVFFLENPGHIIYDRLMESRKRKFSDKLKEMEAMESMEEKT